MLTTSISSTMEPSSSLISISMNSSKHLPQHCVNKQASRDDESSSNNMTMTAAATLWSQVKGYDTAVSSPMPTASTRTASPSFLPAAARPQRSGVHHSAELKLQFSAISFNVLGFIETHLTNNVTTKTVTLLEPLGDELGTPGSDSYQLWHAMAQLPCLQTLKIRYDCVASENWTFPVSALSLLLQEATNLQALVASNLQVKASTTEEWNGFYASLQNHSALQTIQLRSCSFGRSTLQLDPLVTALSGIDTLQEVELSARRHRNVGERRRSSTCSTTSSSLMMMMMDNSSCRHSQTTTISCSSSCWSDDDDGEEDQQEQVGALERLCQSQTLEILSLGNLGGLLHDDVEQMVRGIRNNPKPALKELSLWQCHLSDPDAVALAQILLHTTSSLQTLDLSRNDIGNTGCVSLALALQHNRTLTCLDVSRNSEIGAVGQSALVELVMSSGTNLTEMVVDGLDPQVEQQVQALLLLNQHRGVHPSAATEASKSAAAANIHVPRPEMNLIDLSTRSCK